MPFAALHAEARASRTLSPRLQRAVRLLQMSSSEFAQEVGEALDRNPFLEGEVPRPGEAPPAAEASSDGAAAGARGDDRSDDRGTDAAEPPPGTAGWGWDRPSRRFDGDDDAVFDTLAAEPSLAAHLHAQLALVALPPRDHALAAAIVESLDDDGYLRTDLDELISTASLTPAVSPEELRIALRRVQSLEPAGVAARNVQECLTLQLPSITCPEARALARSIVGEHLAVLAANDVAGLARRLGRPAEVVEQACRCIRRLDPRPGWRHGGGRVDHLTPDVIVKKHRGLWRAHVNPAVVPAVRVNPSLEALFRCQRDAQAASPGLAACLREAQWTVRNVGQRLATLTAVAQAIVDRQGHFLDHGPMAMRPLGLAEIAAALGMHASTVSRATHGKTMATPLGMFELKYFFSRELPTAGGGTCSGTALRSLVAELIAAESPTEPLTDAEIARQLARQGLAIARRTVTKYRQQLRIEPVERRRRSG